VTHVNFRLRMGMLAASVALLAGCGPATATGGPTGGLVSPPAVSASPAPQLEAVTPSAAVAVTTPPAVPTVAGTGIAPATPAPTKAKATTKAPAVHCGADYYVNSSGICVHRPVTTPAAPAGATAECQDGTYSFSQHRQGTCSHHGGVKRWL
jgi:hypothetical protein